MKLVSMICGASLALVAIQGTAQAQALFGKEGPHHETAKPTDIRVYVTTAMAAVLTEDILAQADKALGKHVSVSWGSARGSIQEGLVAGDGDFELAVVLPDVNDNLLSKGKIKPGVYEVTRTPGAFGLRGNATVDVSTPDAVKKTLLGAKSVKYSKTGAALLTTRKVLDTLHIADKIKDDSGNREAVVLTGSEYEMNIFPLSEIIANKSLKNLGPVINELQAPSIIQASIGVKSRDDTGAKAFISFLRGSATDAIFTSDGFEKLDKSPVK